MRYVRSLKDNSGKNKTEYRTIRGDSFSLTPEEAEKIIDFIDLEGQITIGHYISGHESLTKIGQNRYRYKKSDTTMDYMTPTEEVRCLTRDKLKELLIKGFNYSDLAS